MNLPSKTTPSHGGVRGADFDRRSSQFEGRFGRIFRNLPPATWSQQAALLALAGDKASRVTQTRTLPAYKIDLSLVNPLAFLPEFSEVNAQLPQPPLTSVEQLQPPPRQNELPNLALRNLLRGMSMGLHSGQDVAREMGREPLMEDQLKIGKATNQDEFDNLPTLRSINCEFEGKAPLWYYVLAKAQYEWSVHRGNTDTPVRVGAVGSRIVVETFVGLLLNNGIRCCGRFQRGSRKLAKKWNLICQI